MTPAGVGSLVLEDGLSWTGDRETHVTYVSDAAPIRTELLKKHKRACVEFCCNADSLIGASVDDDTFVVRCTEAEDLTTDWGLRFAKGWVDHLGPQMGGILRGPFRVRAAVSVMT